MKKVLLGVFISAFLIACNNEKKDDKPATDTGTAPVSEKKAASELLPLSEGDGVKAAMAAFSKGDIETMTTNYDDNIRFLWSSGDSLIGKQAVKDYYTGRWKLIDSLDFSEQIVLPVKVNEMQTATNPTPGKWVLHWAFAHVKYKNGKKIHFWIHNDYHYNDAGKVDVAIQYIDRAPILEATKGLK